MAHAAIVLRDHGLQHDKRKAGLGVDLELSHVERELARSLANGMRQGLAEVAGCEVDAIRVADVRGKVARQLALEALEVVSERSGRGGIAHQMPDRSGPAARPAPRRRARA